MARMPKISWVTTGALVLFLFASAGLDAQTPALNLLAAIKNLKCSFSMSASGTWQKGEPQARIKMGPVTTFQYTEIDTAESTANVVGLASSGHVVAQLFGANLHFLEMRSTGSLMLTTVFAQESHDKKLKAVHTRADYLPISIPGFVTQPEVSQHYGECEILP
jgi:hypothetical protein